MMLLDRVRRTIGRHDLARPDTRVVAALSGGPDSVALTYLLRELHDAGELCLAGLAHFNHQLRPAAASDEAFCGSVAAALELPLVVDREDVTERMRRERRSIEDAARTARHAFFERARVELKADVVALGHTRDDQAETYALRVLRGAGLRGLASMHPRRGAIIRPLLDCRRADLQHYLNARSLRFVCDESNDDPAIPRNRVRAELLPLLEARFNPSIVDSLADQAELAREEWLWMHGEAIALTEQIGRKEGGGWTLAAERLDRAARALARLVVHRVMTDMAGGRTITLTHVDRVLELGERSRMDAPGQCVERRRGVLFFQSRTPGSAGRWRPERPGDTAPIAPFEHALSIPGEVSLPELGRIVSVEESGSSVNARSLTPPNAREAVAIVQRSAVTRLAVRNRRAGDRFRPIGLGGAKKLQDFFVDRKIARNERDKVPLVVDESDRIIWVAGHALDEEFRVTDPAQAVLILRLKVLGGCA
jgi:tRNA(Ile)-lysidine synthase